MDPIFICEELYKLETENSAYSYNTLIGTIIKFAWLLKMFDLHTISS